MPPAKPPPPSTPVRYASVRIGKRHDPEPGVGTSRQPQPAQRVQPLPAPPPNSASTESAPADGG